MGLTSHSRLVARATAWLRRRGFRVALPEFCTIQGEIPDAWGLDSGGTSCVIEVKVSRSDFLADAKKFHRRNPRLGMGNLRYYMAPAGLIAPGELPEGWGLLAVHGRSIREEYEPTHRPEHLTDRADKRLVYSVLRRLECAGILKDGLDVARLQVAVTRERIMLQRELQRLRKRRA